MADGRSDPEDQVAVEHAATEDTASAPIGPLVERTYPLLVRIAAFRGARSADIRSALADAVRAAAAAAPQDAERVLFRSLIRSTHAVERAAHDETRGGDDVPVVPARQLERDGTRWEGWFKREPPLFSLLERGSAAAEAREAADGALARLPLAQRIVVVLRDIGGWAADDVARLDAKLQPDVQRALLHRGRATVRRALERVAAAKAPTGV